MDEQSEIVNHDPRFHARVLAGPGTGKSFTAVRYMERLSEKDAGLRIRMLTFTRAATAEFAAKLGDASLGGLGVAPPATVHSFALGVLRRAPSHGLPPQLRIPDSWEARHLVRPDLARRMRAVGHTAATPGRIETLEAEMAAGWESLNPDRVLQTDLDPNLVAAFVGHWKAHREAFSFVLVSELPFQAALVLDDHDLDLDLDLLLVDEYQDLNEADIRLIREVARRNVTVIAIGDDDQSIYGFRMAAPHGIRRFLEEFDTACDYPLSTSRRCGSKILAAARAVIESDPTRPPKPPLTPLDRSHQGRYAYLRFPTNQAEILGVCEIIRKRIDAGVEPGQIAILVRSNLNYWCGQLREALEPMGIELASTEWVTNGLSDPALRHGVALAHIAVDRGDSLGWRTLLELTDGVGPAVVDYVLGARSSNETFGAALLRLHEQGFPDGPPSRQVAGQMITSVVSRLDNLDIDGVVLGECGWGEWLLDQIASDAPGEDACRLLREVGASVPVSEGLFGLLAALEPVGKDLAARSPDCVRAMTMAQSKGLTVNTALVLGVEEGIVPMPPPRGDLEEERRLLYVAMTRATDACYLTWARRRTGPSARFGTPNVQSTRNRSPLLAGLPGEVGQVVDGEAFVAQYG